jgi:NAD(P)-dependent dehydrogenase (short-subunit alcohol dehydrogenase family)/acyl carrier protein
LPVDIGRWFRNRGLAPISVAESLQRAKAQANPSQLAWRINGGRAEPWHVQKSSAKAAIEHKETATVSPIPPDRKQTPASSAASQRPANTEVSHEIDRRLKVSSEDQIKSVAPSEALSSVTLSPPPLGTDIQANLASLIDLQRRQQETLWRFMEFQENLLGVGMPRPAHSSLTLPAAPAASVGALAKPTTPTQNAIALDFQQTAVEPPATVSKGATPPTPVLPKFVASPSSVQPQIKAPTSNGAGPSTAAKRIAEPVSRGLDAGPSPILPPTEQFKKELVRVVAERTGYSEEMLDLDAHVEADLGIDSIKRIEIFSTLKDDYPFMEGRDQETVFEELSNLKTLNAVVSWYDSLRSHDNKGGTGPGKKTLTPSQLLPEATESTNLQAPPHAARRYAVIPISAPLGADMKKELLPKDRILLVIGLPDTLRDSFVDGLRSRNCDFVAVKAGQETKLIDENDAEVNFSDINGVQTLRNLLREKGKIVGAIANFAVSEGQSAQFGLARRLFVLLKAFEVDLRSYKRGSWLLNVTAMDGQFGLRRTQRFDVLPAGTLGVAKTLAIEWPEVMVKCVDIDSQIDPQLSVEQVLKEIASGNPVTEVGYTSDGRFTLDLKSDDSEEESLAGLRLEEESVLLVTGGAYGITADIVKAFAKKFKPIIILTGRSRLPEPEGPETLALRSSAELKKFLIESMRARDPKTKPVEIERALTRILRDREIADNLAAMRDAGARVEYHSIDLRDEGGFSQLIQSIYARHGRIDGVLHGAGAIDDKLIKDKQVESFDNVFSTKVIPATVLVKNLKPETLKFFVFFSSIAGRFGNAGQSDYSAANEVINKLAGLLRVDWPHVQTVAINWGPWDGGMVKPELRAFFAQREIFPITLEQGTRRCLEELQHGASGPSEVVVASSLNEIVELTTLSKHRTPANLVT